MATDGPTTAPDFGPGAGDTSTLREPDLALLRTILDSLPGRVAFVGFDDHYVYVNREFLNFHGRKPLEVIGHHVRDVLGEAAYEQISAYNPRIKAGEIVRWEGWITYAGNRRRYIQQTYTPYSPGGGAPQGNIAFGRDLTDLKQREQEAAERAAALAESVALNSAIVGSTLDCLIVVDEEGITVEFNPAAEATFGYRRADVIGRPIIDFIIPLEVRCPDKPGFTCYADAMGPTGLGRRMEIQAVAADGRLVPMDFTVTDVLLGGRRLFLAHMRDLTDAKRAEAEIERQRARINEIEKLSAMGTLLAGVAHELSNPLAIVVAQSTLLKERAPTEDVATRAERIRAAADRSGRIVKSFLAMARETAPQRRPVRLNDIVASTVEMLGYGLRAAEVTVELDLDADLPVISADGDLLVQVVANLVINAQQILQDQPSSRLIRVRTCRVADGMALEVEDNGPGVANDIASRVFDPYFTTKAPGVGTGIGLAISRSVMAAHGGTIELDRGDLGGALFRAVLPSGAILPLDEKAAPF